MRSCLPVALAVAVLCTSCTTSLQSRVPSKDATGEVQKGVIYTLPMTSVEVQADFLVRNCTLNSQQEAQLTFDLVAMSAASSLVPDPSEQYTLDYQALNSALKTTSASLFWHQNGMLKSINAEVDDRNAQVISSIASTALNATKAVLAANSGVAANKTNACPNFIDKLLKDKLQLEDQKLPSARIADDELTAQQKTMTELSVKVALLDAQIKEAKDAKDAVKETQLNQQAKEFKAKVAAASKLIDGKSLQAPALQAELQKIVEKLTIRAKLAQWTPSTKNGGCEEFGSLQQTYWDKLAKALDAPLPDFKPKQSHPTPEQVKAALDEALDAQRRISPPPGKKFAAQACVLVREGAPNGQKKLDGVSPIQGVVYRQPLSGRIYVKQTAVANSEIYAASDISIPQLGSKGLLSLKNGWFDKNSIKVTFNEDGSLSEFGFTQASRAERAAAAASDASGTIADLMKLRADAAINKVKAKDDAEKKEQQKQFDALDNQIKLIEKRRELETARAPAKDELDKQKELLQKQIDVEKLRQEFEELKKKAGTS